MFVKFSLHFFTEKLDSQQYRRQYRKSTVQNTKNSSKMTHAAEQAQQTGSTCSDKSTGAVAGMAIETFGCSCQNT